MQKEMNKKLIIELKGVVIIVLGTLTKGNYSKALSLMK